MLSGVRALHLGTSFQQNKPVAQLIREKLPVSVSLGLWSLLLTYLVSLPLGIAKAVRDGSAFDFATSLAVLVGFAIPGFVLGVLLIVLFAGGSFFDVFAARPGLRRTGTNSPGRARLLLAPDAAAGVPVDRRFATTFLTKRTPSSRRCAKQYVLVARAKGLSQRQVLWKHVFRNALIPIVTGFRAPSSAPSSARCSSRRCSRSTAWACWLRGDPAPRLPGGAGLAVPVHAHRPMGALVSDVAYPGRPARAVRAVGR